MAAMAAWLHDKRAQRHRYCHFITGGVAAKDNAIIIQSLGTAIRNDICYRTSGLMMGPIIVVLFGTNVCAALEMRSQNGYICMHFP